MPRFRVLPILAAAAVVWVAEGCSSTKSLREDQRLLRTARVQLRTSDPASQRGPLTEALDGAIVQRPNDYALGIFPYKLYFYNARLGRYRRDTAHYQLRAGIAQPPVVYDSSAQRRAAQNMRGVLFTQGYYYGSVQDTVEFRGKKAHVTYRVETGPSYLIDTVTIASREPTIGGIVQASMQSTVLERGTRFSNLNLETERRRVAEAVRNAGYYRFSAENISFQLDTLNQPPRRTVTTLPLLDAAIAYAARQRPRPQPTLDIEMRVRAEEDSSAFFRYRISRVTVYPDYSGPQGYGDTAFLRRSSGGIDFRYRQYYINEKVVARHIFLEPGAYFSQTAYDRTVTRLGELGVFQYTRVYLYEDTSVPNGQHALQAAVLLSPAKRYDANANLETSTGTNYDLGSAISVGLRNRNVGRGANALSLTVSGGVEMLYPRNDEQGNILFNTFFLRSRNLGATAALEFPKFIAPFKLGTRVRRNFPRTILSAGIASLQRVEYFTLVNTSASFSYSWRSTDEETYELAPAFVNVQQVFNESTAFTSLKDSSSFLRNSYADVFILGQSIARTFSDADQGAGRSYSFLRIGLEEAGGILSGVQALGNATSGNVNFPYAQYVRLDVDARRYFPSRGSLLATRFVAGIGIPYGGSQNLPFIKQYFVGGPNSIRGWRVRTLGPGSFVDPDNEEVTSTRFIDRTGDIRLEANAEYRFDLFELFAGALKMAGATFVDAGNIWLAKPSSGFPNGEFRLSQLAPDLAVSGGFGLRADVAGFFTLRLDVGIPLKQPSRTGPDWIFNPKERLSARDWRSANLIPQIGIGYPF